MFVTNLTSDADYFLKNKDFASVSYNGTHITYTFDLYGKILQALIDGHDNIKVQIVKNFTPEFKYFVGDSKSDVELSNVGFVSRTKAELQADISEATIIEKTITISSLLPDETISDVGNKKINEKSNEKNSI